ncbi:uncharacterized protein A1O9_00456 [Exophiala aquamarina CBS 119918]|uniref:Uncharacterized protein n=1 Tax=Exophiala aquamarina CBS 119918 TaxID=1182545 RepID=A0A072PT16_9EURO|nr:uncharacterized protein A1O9_00456 [Exophiala aquamarina CBS 119918]KEF62483.1 hypothetical protein A1O9_00456 [Exophiala aquamarina CBS 119918]
MASETSCSLPGQTAPEKKTPIGPIVGGVIGGLAVLAVISYLVWRFCLRKKPRVNTWDPPEKRDQSTLSRSARQSTRSAHSIASTVFTRASNVIQIAYIPGVTVRSPPESPGLVPPVPSLPGTRSNASTPHMEQHFFMPGDLRDSTWSDTSFDPRISIAPSLARDSVAGTIYQSDAIVPPIPAQHAFRAQANVVSVKSGPTTPSSGATPNMRTPQIPQVPNLGSSNSSIVAKNAVARPIEIKKVSSGTRVPTLGNLAKQASQKSGTPDSSEKKTPVFWEEKEVVVSSAATTPNSALDSTPVSPITIPRPAFAGHTARSSGVSSISPFQTSTTGGTTHRHTNSNSATLNAMIEDAINRARDPQHMGAPTPAARPNLIKHDSSPFSDANEVKENIP